MADVDISYKGNVIASMNDSGMAILETAGKYCEDDITVAYTKSGGGGGGSTSASVNTTGYVVYQADDGTVNTLETYRSNTVLQCLSGSIFILLYQTLEPGTVLTYYGMSRITEISLGSRANYKYALVCQID